MIFGYNPERCKNANPKNRKKYERLLKLSLYEEYISNNKYIFENVCELCISICILNVVGNNIFTMLNHVYTCRCLIVTKGVENKGYFEVTLLGVCVLKKVIIF